MLNNMTSLSLAAVLIFVYMTGGFLLATFKKRNDVVDPMWGAGFALVALGTYLGVMSSRNIVGAILVLLVVIWATRLTVRLIKRVQKKTEEDYRYKKWREEWMRRGGVYFYMRSFLQVFMLQGLLMFIIALPFIVVQSVALPSEGFLWFYGNTLFVAGVIVWVIGFTFEVIGDWQLSKFLSKRDNKGKIMQSGLWKYSRHPNYFGEAALWWGVWLIATSVNAPLWTIISPITITFLLLKVSGVPMLEAQWKGSKVYEKYKEKTSVFIPLPPRS